VVRATVNAYANTRKRACAGLREIRRPVTLREVVVFGAGVCIKNLGQKVFLRLIADPNAAILGILLPP